MITSGGRRDRENWCYRAGYAVCDRPSGYLGAEVMSARMEMAVDEGVSLPRRFEPLRLARPPSCRSR